MQPVHTALGTSPGSSSTSLRDDAKAAARPPVVFAHTVEALLERVKGHFSREELEHLAGPKPHELSLVEWVRLVRACAARLHPEDPEHAGAQAVGRELVRGLTENLFTRPLVLLMRTLGPRRTLLHLAQTFRCGGSVNESVSVHELAHGHGVDVVLNDTGGLPPSYIRGMLSEVMLLLRVTHSVASSTRADGTPVFTITWDPN